MLIRQFLVKSVKVALVVILLGVLTLISLFLAALIALQLPLDRPEQGLVFYILVALFTWACAYFAGDFFYNRKR